MQGDTVLQAVLLVFVLGQTRIDDAFVAGRGLGLLEGFEHGVHVVLELVDVGEGIDVEGGEEVVLRQTRFAEHGGRGGGEHGCENFHHHGEAVAFV